MVQFGENIAWMLLLFVGSLLASTFLYFYQKDGYARLTRSSLAVLRFGVLFFIGLFLLDPLIKYNSTEEEKPIYIIGIDKSESIVANADSSEIKIILRNLIQEVSENQNVKVEVLGFVNSTISEFDTTFNGTETNISSFLNYVNDNYAFRNVAGQLLISDGILNKGLDPQYLNLKTNAAIDVIALGDTAIRPDHRITETRYNKLVYLNNKFPLAVSIASDNLKGKSAELLVQSSSGESYSKQVNYSSNFELQTFDFQLEAQKTGIQIVTINLAVIDGESNAQNNRVTIPIEVLDTKEQVALIYQNLSPDIGVFNKVLSKNENIDLELIKLSELDAVKIDELANEFNSLILYQLPSTTVKANTALLKKVFELEVPKMYVIGTGTNLFLFDNLNSSFTRKGSDNGMFNTATPRLNQDFTLFNLPEDVNSILTQLPPVFTPFGEFEIKGKMSHLLYQNIGTVKSEYPLWSFAEFNGVNSVYLFANGFWRWPLSEYQVTKKSEFVTSLVENSVSYLSVRKDKSRLRIKSESNYNGNEEVLIQAELYNELYEPINDPNIELELVAQDTLSYKYNFERKGNGYELNLGKLESGLYDYKASVKESGEEIIKKGQFSVSKQKLELTNLRANHNLLYKLSERTEGGFYTLENIDEWKTKFNNTKYSSVLYTEINFRDLIDLQWLFVALLFLLSTEWLVRKREGFL